MKSTLSSFSLVTCAVALGCGLPALASAEEPISTTAERLNASAEQQDPGAATARISTRFTTLAGSEDNARALVSGLRDGTVISLNSTAADGTVMKTEFQPVTAKLGYGNAFISLALAEESLAKAGISSSPTATQLVAALNGGEISLADGTTATLSGVLAMRAAGQGWGDIARSLGVKLGPVVSSLHAANRRIDTPSRPEAVGRPERVAGKPERAPGKPVTAGRPETAGRPLGVGRPEGVGRPMTLPPPTPPVGRGRP